MAQFMFVAGGEACGACAAMDGTISEGGIGQQHENCQCQDVPVDRNDDCPKVEVGTPSIQTSGATSSVGVEVTVRCCDGTEIGESLEQDLGPSSPTNIEDALAAFAEFVEAAADELAVGCPESIPVWVEDGEEDGLA